jgi:hypothetical protein
MLKAVQELGESVTHKQLEELKAALGEKLYGLLDSAFDADSEEDAKSKVNAFVEEARQSPLKVLKARRFLDADQKALIMKLMEN